MDIYIKNMVCNRCKLNVAGIMEKAGYPDAEIKLGKVSVKDEIPDDTLRSIDKQLNSVGFEIIGDAKTILIEEIKKLTIEYVYDLITETNENFSEFLVSRLNRDYGYLSKLFSSVEGTTIEKHLINLKIERVKEMLVYNQETLSEIAYKMGYSSVAHLSGQFRKITGFTPSYFKKLGEEKRKSIDEV
ncbi:MAG: AraC family transcriptional regulator [Bacteroidales bacterium]|nr:AraC family transcriptional regulator [Bacteroidales bacterium]MDT8430585.1 AraC family transcriptional regulator [Bacteroidales bacterium]